MQGFPKHLETFCRKIDIYPNSEHDENQSQSDQAITEKSQSIMLKYLLLIGNNIPYFIHHGKVAVYALVVHVCVSNKKKEETKQMHSV